MAAHQAPPSMGFSKQEYWSGVPLPSPTTPQVPVYYLGQEAQVSWFYWNSDTSPTWRRFRQVNLSLASTWVIPSGDFKCSVSQSCPTLCDSMDCSLPSSFVHGISQARILEWVAIFHLQGIFPTQGLNPCLLWLLHWQILYHWATCEVQRLHDLTLTHGICRVELGPKGISMNIWDGPSTCIITAIFQMGSCGPNWKW